MSHRPLIVLLLVASLLLVAAGETPTTVATDACADPTTERDAGVTPWTDLCVLAVDTSEGPDGMVLEVRVDVASTDRLAPSVLDVAWQQDGCTTRLAFGDANLGEPSFSTIGRDCGDGRGMSDCLAHLDEPVPYGLFCRGSYDRVDVDAPTVETGGYVWRIPVTGEVGDVVGSFAPGTVLDDFRVEMAGRAQGRGSLGLLLLCSTGGPQERCWASGLDHMLGTGSFTVR